MAKALGRYRIACRLGQGGQAVVYEAFDPDLGRKVALKVLRPGTRSDHAMERLLREARAAAKLDHPNIVSIYDVGEAEAPGDALRAAQEQPARAGEPPADGRPAADTQKAPPPPRRLRRYLAMELVEGGSLQAALDRREFSVREAVSVAYLVARAAHRAHSQGIIHRDIKPGNVLLALDGTPKLTDFGFALDAGEHERLTLTGTTMGTPAYMAPEQALGKSRDADARTDVYAIGALLYRILAGRPPFIAETSLELLRRAARETPRPPSDFRAAMPPEADTICLKCLEKDPARRYQTAEELAEDCRRLLERGFIRAKRTSVAYRARSAVMRHKVAAAGLTVALAACAGLEIRTRAAVRRQRAEAAKLSAEAAKLRSAALRSAGEAESLEDGIAGVRREAARLREELAGLHRRSTARMAGRRKPPRGELPLLGETRQASTAGGEPRREEPPEPVVERTSAKPAGAESGVVPSDTRPAPATATVPSAAEGAPSARDPASAKVAPPAPVGRVPGFFAEAESAVSNASVSARSDASRGKVLRDVDRTGVTLHVEFVITRTVSQAVLALRLVATRARELGLSLVISEPETGDKDRRPVYLSATDTMQWSYVPLHLEILPGRYWVGLSSLPGDGGTDLDMIGIVSAADPYARRLPNRLVGGRLEEGGRWVEVGTPKVKLSKPEPPTDEGRRPGGKEPGAAGRSASGSEGKEPPDGLTIRRVIPESRWQRVEGYFVEAESGIKPDETVYLGNVSDDQAAPDFNRTRYRLRLAVYLRRPVTDAFLAYRYVKRYRPSAPLQARHKLVFTLTSLDTFKMVAKRTVGDELKGSGAKWGWVGLERRLPAGSYRVGIYCEEGDGGSALDVVGIVPGSECRRGWLPNHILGRRLQERGYYIEVARVVRMPILPRRLR